MVEVSDSASIHIDHLLRVYHIAIPFEAAEREGCQITRGNQTAHPGVLAIAMQAMQETRDRRHRCRIEAKHKIARNNRRRFGP